MPSDSDQPPKTEHLPPAGDDRPPLVPSGLGSGLLAQQPTPNADEAVTVARVCPQCGTEYDTADRFCTKDGASLRPKAAGDPLIGRVIADRYLVLAQLGEGGMGRVYLAEHVKMNRQCAIKVMNPSLIHDTESLQRFAREASSAARILHPNVAAVFDYGDADKIVYLVMEYVDGEPLSTILARDGALEPRRAIDIARQMADGLHAAHELGIVHRDLKPDNVIVTRKAGKEIPKIVDFGIAKALTDAPQDALTRSGLVIGTPEFMSPEQLLGDPVDARADVYSLGCIFYQMLTGEPAFKADSREQMIRRRLHEPPPHVRDVLPDLPRRVDTLITHMLARSPSDRLASAAEARDALDPALALGGWDPTAISTRGPLATAEPYRDDPSLRPTMPMPKVRTSPKRIAIGAAVGSALLLGGMTMWANSGQQPQRAPVPVSAPKTDTPQVVAAAPPSADSLKKLPALSTRDTATKDTVVRPKPVATSEFDAPLGRLASALETKDMARVRAAFPGITQTQESVIAQVLARVGTRTPSVTRGFGTVEVSGSRATRRATFNLQYTDPTSLARASTPLTYVATYEQRSGKWDLVSLTTP